MWLLSTLGCFSVVEHPGIPEALLVQTCVRADLQALRRRLLPDLVIERTDHPDHPFQAVLPRDEWAHAANRLACEIDYPSFEAAVEARHGAERARRYRRAWAEVHP